jgi:seryl-tRNA synthetase
MLDLKLIRTQPDMVRELCRRRHATVDFDKLLEADERTRALTAQLDALRAKRKGGGGKPSSAEDAREAAIALRNEVASAEEELRVVKTERDRLWSWVPNLLADDTPVGKDDKDNVEIKHWGNPPKADFELKTHEVIGQNLGVIDEDRGAKVAGAGYSYWLGDGARLTWGLFSLALDYLAKRGFKQMFTPVVAKGNTLFGTGYLPYFSDQIYKIEGEDLNLIGTSEQTLVGYHSDEILPPEKLPLLYTAFTPCFRTESGSYGRETKGLFRQHQFHKVEQIVFCEPSTSEEWLDKCLENAEGILKLLEIPYRVVRVCDGDMGAPGYKKYDVEAWFAGFGSYRETHSITNLLDFQSRRLNIRSKQAGNTFHPHTISATMITDRALLALLEHNQQADGSVRVPEALRPFVDGRSEIRKSS